MKIKSCNRDGSTLVVTIIVVATLLVLLGTAVDYTTQISRATQRSRKTALAVEIADGHLETLFTNWRNIYRTTWTSTAGYPSGGTDYSLVGTNYFYTPMYSPAPAPTAIPQMSPSPGVTPPNIPLPASSNFPTEANYTVTQYRIQAVDPMITLDSNGNALVESGSKGGGSYVAMSTASVPPAGFGPNQAFGITTGGFPYSYFYLASVDVSVPALAGNVTAKVRRVFEKKFDLPWSYAMFFVNDLEFQPSTPLTMTGPIHTNGSLYIGTSNFTAANPTYASPTPFPTSGRVEYGADYVNGYSPKDPRYPGSGFTAPNFAKSNSSLALSDCPPSQVSPYLPFGWNLKLNSSGGGSGGTNDDSYHEIIERPAASPSPDPLANVRYYSQPGYRVIINADTTVTVTRIDANGVVTNVSGNTYNNLVGNNGQGTSTTVLQQGKALYDAREGAAVRVTNLDIAKLVSNVGSLTGWTGLMYVADAGAATYNADGTVKTAGTAATVTINGVNYSTTRRALRLINGYQMPSTPAASPYPATSGLTIVSENPVYIQGNYNTSATSGASVPSNSGTYTSPTASGYTRLPSAVVADAVTILSPGWNDANSAQGIGVRAATANTTVNAALGSGNVLSNVVHYSGGGENFIRLLEDWSTHTFCYYGSMVQLYQSNQAIGPWNGNGSVYVSPQTSRWYHDYATFADGSPPGSLQIAAYLQQQRWYEVY